MYLRILWITFISSSAIVDVYSLKVNIVLIFSLSINDISIIDNSNLALF